MPEEVSHGRGGKLQSPFRSSTNLCAMTLATGAGNINPDSTPYTDGEIVREGAVGDHGDGPYSAGRGGAGNIGSPHVKPTNVGSQRGDSDIIPETALRESGASGENYHIGRGGGGNVHKEKHDGEAGEEKGLGEKLKHKLMGKKD
ncbi:MAG: hypothetical protein Q9211_000666 [Gyalolechia sp. 1 TL-2023]